MIPHFFADITQLLGDVAASTLSKSSVSQKIEEIFGIRFVILVGSTLPLYMEAVCA
jgi:hypothetical protein